MSLCLRTELTVLRPPACSSALLRRYNRLVGSIQKIVHRLKALDAEDPERISSTQQLLDRLSASTGIIPRVGC